MSETAYDESCARRPGDESEPLAIKCRQPYANGVPCESRLVMDAKTVHKLLAMGIDRVDTEVQPSGYVLHRVSFRDQLQDFPLTRRQEHGGLDFPRRSSVLARETAQVISQHWLGDPRTQMRLSAGHRLNGEFELSRGGVLYQIPCRPSS